METLAWPGAVVVLCVIFMIVFKKSLTDLITRARRITKDGVDIDPSLPQSSATAEAGKEREKLPTAEQIQRRVDNALLAPIEAQIQEHLGRLALKDPNEREKYLAHLLAATLVARDFELFYSLIWGSQLQAIVVLNTAGAAGMHPTHLVPIYQQAKTDYPQFYAEYTFDQWLGFLVDRQLVARKDPVVHITLAGREFLKFIVDNGKQAYKDG